MGDGLVKIILLEPKVNRVLIERLLSSFIDPNPGDLIMIRMKI